MYINYRHVNFIFLKICRVRMYVCHDVCMYVCMFVWMNEWMNETISTNYIKYKYNGLYDKRFNLKCVIKIFLELISSRS